MAAYETSTGSVPPEHLVLLHQQMMTSLQVQSTEISSVTTRASMLLTPVGVVLGLALIAHAQGSLGPALAVVTAIGFGALIASLVAGAGGLFPLPRVALFPLASRVWPGLERTPDEPLLREQCGQMLYAYETNERVLSAKHAWLVAESILLGTGAILIGIAYIVGQWGKL